MCGLAGVLSSDMDEKKVHIFQGLMTVATLRGTIGAGVAFVPSEPGPVHILRHTTETAAELVAGHEFYKYTKSKKNRFSCLMGHARAPTTGGFDIKDIHPHVSRHIIGMHNGHMKTVSGKDVGKEQNDSAVLFEAIGNQGIEDAIRGSVGAYSLTIYNKQTQRLYFLRNRHRPLHFCMVEGDPKTLYWASEAMMLQLVVGRAVTTKLHHYTLPPNELVSFPVFDKDGIRFEERKEVKGHEETETKLLAPPSSTTFMYPTQPGHYVSKEDLNNLLAKGCANCNEAFTYDDYVNKEMLFFAPNEFVCRECLTHDQTARDYVLSHGVHLPTDLVTTH